MRGDADFISDIAGALTSTTTRRARDNGGKRMQREMEMECSIPREAEYADSKDSEGIQRIQPESRNEERACLHFSRLSNTVDLLSMSETNPDITQSF